MFSLRGGSDQPSPIDETIEGSAQYQDAGKRRTTETRKPNGTAGEIPGDTDR